MNVLVQLFGSIEPLQEISLTNNRKKTKVYYLLHAYSIINIEFLYENNITGKIFVNFYLILTNKMTRIPNKTRLDLLVAKSLLTK